MIYIPLQGVANMENVYLDILRHTFFFFQSHRMLGFFFDELMPGSQVRIVPKDDPDTS